MKISLCMIVKNEEAVLKRCLDSIEDIVDEIVIVDTGSIDRTKEIAEQYTAKVYDFKWIDDFSAARNFAFSKGTQEYLMWLDADDVVSEGARAELQKLKSHGALPYDVIMMKYDVGFDEHQNVTLSYYRERLFRKSMNFKWVEPVHEVIPPRGNIHYLEASIIHRNEGKKSNDRRNLRIYENELAKNKELSPRGTYYYARELYYNQFYEKAIRYFNKFLNTKRGWVEDCIQACKLLSSCYSQTGDKENQLQILLKSFEYDNPRADICCEIGNVFFDSANYKSAIFWYELAANQKPSAQSHGFVYHDYYGYIPCIQLCLCYYQLGDLEKAIAYNERAGVYKPESAAFLYNKNFFNSSLS